MSKKTYAGTTNKTCPFNGYSRFNGHGYSCKKFNYKEETCLICRLCHIGYCDEAITDLLKEFKESSEEEALAILNGD